MTQVDADVEEAGDVGWSLEYLMPAWGLGMPARAAGVAGMPAS
jgi:hypothetical protein